MSLLNIIANIFDQALSKANRENRLRKKIKIFKLTEMEWWAGESLKQVKDEFRSWDTRTDENDEIFEYAYEVDEENMNLLEYHDEEGKTRTFRQQLDLLIEQEQEFPCIFAVENC